MFELPKTEAQVAFKGPDDMRAYADFLPLIGEFVLRFGRLERYVTWAIESFIGASRYEGNELEGLVQNFTSRIKFLDIASRNRCTTDASLSEQKRIIAALADSNSFWNKILHNSAVGFEIRKPYTPEQEVSLMIKRLDPKTGGEKQVRVSAADIAYQNQFILTLINSIVQWVHSICPNAEKRVP